MRGVLRALLDFVFPPQCGGCDAVGVGLCRTCLPDGPALFRALPTITVGALGAYDGPLRRAVLALKNGRRDVAEAFAQRLAGRIDEGATIVPVPTTAARRRARGFDGCEAIAQIACGDRAQVRASLVQVRGETQRGRGRSARLAPRQRFVWRGADLCGTHVVLLDDVVTTGATLEECAAVVRSHGGVVRKALAIASA